MPDVILFGCGALGTRLLRVLEADYSAINVVGAVDHSADLIGSTLGASCGSGRFANVPIVASLEQCLESMSGKPDALIHMTESKPDRIESQLAGCYESGIERHFGGRIHVLPLAAVP